MRQMNAAVRLLQFSDPHLFASPHGTLRGVPPLASMQRQLPLVEGLDFQSEYPDTSSATNGHIGGEPHALSSISRVGPSAAGGISIDQFIANGINTPTPLTQLPALQMWPLVPPSP